jgi:hypothetical protein
VYCTTVLNYCTPSTIDHGAQSAGPTTATTPTKMGMLSSIGASLVGLVGVDSIVDLLDGSDLDRYKYR